MDQIGNFINLNGKFIPAGTPVITADSHAFRYGDGLFETMRVRQASIPLRDLHMDRLFSGLRLLQFELPDFFTRFFLMEQVMKLLKKNKMEIAARVRLQVFRQDGGLYDIPDLKPQFIIQTWSLDGQMRFNENGFVTGIHENIKKSCDNFSNVKSCNYLPSVIAANLAKANKWNECFIVNTFGRICDATITNVFWIENQQIYTPPLSEGGIAGVMRHYLLEQLPMVHFNVSEQPMNISHLQTADEVFLTNAINGIRWVRQFGEKTFGHSLSFQIFSQFIKNLG